MNSRATRLAELFADGGVSEVIRGILDYLSTTVVADAIAFTRSDATVVVDGIALTVEVNSGQDIKRVRTLLEPALLQDLLQTVRADDVVWDIGANIGLHTLTACAAGADHVVAFEPGAPSRKQLLRNLAANDAYADVRPFALGATATDAVLRENEQRGSRALADGGPGEPVQVRVGDRVYSPAPDVLKVDVEGAEVEVLDGLCERLQDVRVAYVEVHDGVSESAVVARLDAAGLTERTRVDGLIRASQ